MTRRWLPPRRVTLIEIDFGPDETTLATADIAAPWTTDAPITLTPTGEATEDHDPEDALIEEIRAYAINQQPGIGYTAIAYAPNGTWGRHTFHAIG